ncbi:hypothetical protein [Dysgonomonas sp. 25]|uniref:hypothetical protein n=1 Tax=Dysgonomonas sp. 25 TaxID=2302933 RepID=UPI0013D6110F|nr:hypothetical protein [Dysgonomonas sp. 25]NDV68375.1 hypothetical protein [Dysgonomonas sp. 25]
MKKTLTQAIIILAFLTTTIGLHGQVTIGSGEKPNAGALLDLKMNANGLSTLGLGLPRVQLSKLRPTTDTELAQSIGNTSESYNMADHVGLIVYNTLDNPLCGRPAGPFLWDGEQWVQLMGTVSESGPKGSYAEDVQALKDLYNANPGNTLGWNLSGDPTTFAGVTWTTICGEKRVTELMLFAKQLTFATGIGKLYTLTFLNCHSNKLTSLDVSTNTALTTLYCQLNRLTSLDVSGATALTKLNCHSNPLTTLDVSANTNLTSLECSFIQLTQTEVDKFKLHPNYCPCISSWSVAPQYFPGTTTADYSITKPTCP